MAGTNKRITPERYQQIKTILDLIPIGKEGVGLLHNTLGIASSTASYIRRSKNYVDYMSLLPKKQKKVLVQTPEPKTDTNANANDNKYLEKILDKLDQIDNHLNNQDREFVDFRDLYQWVANHAVLDTHSGWRKK